MMRALFLGFLLLPVLMGTAQGTSGASTNVELELATERGFPVTASRDWIEVLKDLGHSGLRIRQARPGDRAEVKNRGTSAAPRYHVTGILTARNTLRLPGGTFTLNDKPRIAAWLDKLQRGGERSLTTPTGPFGMTQEQLVALDGQLAARVPFATQGQPVGQVSRRMAALLPLDFAVDPASRQALASSEPVRDELQGLSIGTALAAVLRPLGLVLVPEKPLGESVRLRIREVRQAEQSWPVGWPSEKSPQQALPELFTFLNVEIQDISLAEALTAIQERLEVPFLVDHNALARHRVDLQQVNVSLPEGRTYYQRILSRLLIQARLTHEIRTDEAGQSFLWISTIKK